MRKGILGILVALAVFAGLQAGIPAVRRWNHARQVDALLRTDPLFKTIIADTPAVREPMRAAMIKSYATGRPDEAFLAGNRLLAPLLPRYMARSSDSAIVGFAQTLAAGLREIAAQDPEDCYRFLFPNADGPPKRRIASTEKAMADAVRAVVTSAPTASAVEANPQALVPVFERLHARYGEQLAILQNAEAPGQDRKLICEMAIDLYTEIVQLPEREAASGLRQLLAAAPPR